MTDSMNGNVGLGEGSPVEHPSTTSALKVITVRRWECNDICTIGGMYDESKLFAFTLERPWKNNQTDVSSVPEGEYMATRFLSPHFGYEVWRLSGVKGRDAIEIHPVNYVKDLNGCIGVGNTLKDLSLEEQIFESRDAFEELMERTQGHDKIKIVIVKLK